MIMNYLAFRVDEELGEVPRDLRSSFLLSIIEWTVHPKILVDRMRIWTIHFDLRKHGKFDSIRLCGPCFYLSVSSWLLLPKLVARKSKDFETLFGELLMELHHFFVVLVCYASLGCNVNNHNAFFAL